MALVRDDGSWNQLVSWADALALLPTIGVVAGNDLSAVGVIEILTRNGISVPGKVKVVGFDDSPVATRNSPAITTIRQPSRELGAQVAKSLIAKLNGQEVEDKILDVKLIKRESTAR